MNKNRNEKHKYIITITIKKNKTDNKHRNMHVKILLMFHIQSNLVSGGPTEATQSNMVEAVKVCAHTLTETQLSPLACMRCAHAKGLS